ncbi:hypothetical protein ISP15_09850 [Dyella jejuensis]|uniref:Uncharacterized protein n=1 Tax=Dyella jejuensis TaxID=1432009 RepID=A0ABW8JJI4_9GAMM
MIAHKKPDPHAHANPVETAQELLKSKRERSQAPPSWPHAEDQPRQAQVSARTSSLELNQGMPSESGHERNDIGKRHH